MPQMLANPKSMRASDLEGITYVVSRMNWYCVLIDKLLKIVNEDNIANKGDNVNEDSNINEQKIANEAQSFQSIRKSLEQRVVELYKAILLYQMKSVCSYYRNKYKEFFLDLVDLKGWDDARAGVTTAENTLKEDWEQYNLVQMNDVWGSLIEHTGKIETHLGNIDVTIRDVITQQQRTRGDEKKKQCLRDLYYIDPQDDMQRILEKKEDLLEGAYEWIFEDERCAAFTNLGESDLPPCRVLWVKGVAGTGKTMLLIGIIRRLSDQPANLASTLSYFFCQSQSGTTKALNSATATLRSLIWMLLLQQPNLIEHLLSKYEYSGASLFTDQDSFHALSGAFESMLRDPQLSPVYFIVDALDECDERDDGLAKLLPLISNSLELSDKVRWLVSSRPELDVLALLKNRNTKSRHVGGTPLELNDQSQEGPVGAYINYKLAALQGRPGYSADILTALSNEILQREEKIFLWVALVFKLLDETNATLQPVHGSYALRRTKTIPSGLSELYSHMMTRIDEGELEDDPHLCKQVLAATAFARRGLSLLELDVLAGLPPSMAAKTIVRKCGSFLTTKEETVTLVHKSAKDYLEKYQSSLPGGAFKAHEDIIIRSINSMSTLKRSSSEELILQRNIYDLAHWGIMSKDITPPDLDPLASIHYSCIFWLDHLCDAIKENAVKENLKSCTELYDLGLKFLKQHFLHWVESLSLLHRLSDGIISINKLLNIIQVCLWRLIHHNTKP